MYCLENPENLELKGDLNADVSKYLTIKYIECDNKIDKNCPSYDKKMEIFTKTDNELLIV